jgi:hypothetical protein
MAGVPASIPWTAIEKYARQHGFTGSSFDDLVTIVRAMDEAYRDKVIKELPSGDG